MKNTVDIYKPYFQKRKLNTPDINEAKIIALQVYIKKLKRENNPKKAGSYRKKGKLPKKDSTKPKWFLKCPPKDELQKPKKWKGAQLYYCHPDICG